MNERDIQGLITIVRAALTDESKKKPEPAVVNAAVDLGLNLIVDINRIALAMESIAEVALHYQAKELSQ